jgi:glycosyltransferase involved in cell wall biosynthesis
MRILLLAPHPFFSVRGTPIAVRDLLQVLGGEGHAIDVATYFEGADVEIPGVRVYRIRRPWGVRSVPIGVSWQKVPCDWRLYELARRLMSQHRYDLIHAVEESAILASTLSARSGIPFVFDMDSIMSRQIADTHLLLRPIARLFKLLEGRALRRAAAVLAVSPGLADYARQNGASGLVTVVPDAPQHSSSAARAVSELGGGSGVAIVYVGNFKPYQGVDLLIEGFRQAAFEDGGATLWLIGGEPRAVARLRRTARDLVASGRVRFEGSISIDAMMATLNAADVLVSPRRAGFNTPMKIYNYLAAGKAVLATRIPAHTDVFDDECAMLVDPVASDLAEGLRVLVGDPILRQKLGEGARLRSEQLYSREHYRERVLAFYSKVSSIAGI